jgi:hypothetical protein
VGIETATDISNFVNTDEFGQSATYTSPAGATVSCSVHLIEGLKLRDEATGEWLDVSDVIWVALSEVASPARDGYFTIGANVYRVNELGDRDRNMVSVLVRKDQ